MITKPKTIDELKQWYSDRNLPPYETTRFFIGENYYGARAFGIYKEGDFVTVYKNKNDGTRAIRYTGTDEAYAVSEIFQKLLSEISSQKARNGKSVSKKTVNAKTITIVTIIAALLTWIGIDSCKDNKKKGYYEYNNKIYYFYAGNWYLYDESLADYKKTNVDGELDRNYKNYAVTDDSYYESSLYDFYDSGAYEAIRSDDYSDSDDSDFDWDSGDSWDSGGTDFDSDW